MSDDAYDNATFYSTRDPENLTCETVEDALTEWVEMRVERGMTDDQVEKLVRDHGPIKVTAYQRMPISDAWLAGEAASLLDRFAEDFADTYGDEDGNTYRDATAITEDPTIMAQTTSLLRAITDRTQVWQCDDVGSREYDADAVLAMLTSAGYFEGTK